jgi:uncharacterized protein YraI
MKTINKKLALFVISISTLMGTTTVLADTYTTTGSLNMRTGPSTAYARILTLPGGIKVESLSVASTGWHKVSYSGKTGYISNRFVTLVSKTPVAIPTPAPEPSPGTGSACRTTGTVNMRSGPTKAYPILQVVPSGTEVAYLSTDASGWNRVSYKGKTGYISNNYSVVISTEAPAPVDVPVTPELPVPAVPEPVPAPAETIPEPVATPEPAPVPAEPVPAPVVSPEPAPVQVVTPEPVPVAATGQLVRTMVYYPTTTLNLRSGVGTGYPVLLALPKGAHLNSQEVSAGWHRITYAGQTGWASGTYLKGGMVHMVDGTIIASKGYGLPADFAPGVNPEALAAVNRMKSDAAKEGITLNPFSTYRSYSYQSDLYRKYVASDGAASADTYSAKPGFSEHQTGLAFDIGGANSAYYLKRVMGQMKEGLWMAQNAQKYGLILRYPEGKQAVTGYNYEPWHFRYVGVELAQKITSSGLTLDEYFGVVAPGYR